MAVKMNNQSIRQILVFFRTVIFGLILWAGMIVWPACVQANLIELMSGSGVLWEAKWSNDLPKDLLVDVGQVYKDGKPTKISGHLKKTVTFVKGMDKLVIEFRQLTPALKNAGGKQDETGSGPSGGLFFRISEEITNGTEDVWQSYTQILEDKKPFKEEDYGTETHPAKPHFHTALLRPTNVTPLKLVKPGMEAHGTDSVVFGKGMVNPKDKFKIIADGRGNLRIHEIEIKGENNKRAFDLIEIPSTNAIPEPGTMMLLGSGLIGMVGYTRLFRKN
jgi:hypothetical protein